MKRTDIIGFAKDKIRESAVSGMIHESTVFTTISNIEQYCLGLERQLKEAREEIVKLKDVIVKEDLAGEEDHW